MRRWRSQRSRAFCTPSFAAVAFASAATSSAESSGAYWAYESLRPIRENAFVMFDVKDILCIASAMNEERRLALKSLRRPAPVSDGASAGMSTDARRRRARLLASKTLRRKLEA